MTFLLYAVIVPDPVVGWLAFLSVVGEWALLDVPFSLVGLAFFVSEAEFRL